MFKRFSRRPAKAGQRNRRPRRRSPRHRYCPRKKWRRSRPAQWNLRHLLRGPRLPRSTSPPRPLWADRCRSKRSLRQPGREERPSRHATAPPAATPGGGGSRCRGGACRDGRGAQTGCCSAAGKPLGRPLTLQEKLAKARGAARCRTRRCRDCQARCGKPAAAKAAAPAAKPAGAARVLPPLDKITDPRDLAEALRQAGAKKAKEVAAAAKAAAATPAKPAAAAKPAPAKPQSVLPKPAKGVAAATASAGQTDRRGFMVGSLFISWVAAGWTAFTAGCVALTGMTGRFMFPNVLAEPPSTVKVGEPSSYDPNDVNERFKAESGFWIVRSNRYSGQDIIYALQSVCTHLGCPPNWLANEQKFKCPCHGSGFYITGINFEGPAPRPLERFKVTLADDGQIVVDKSQKFQQELGQWSDPDSFIAV